MNKRITNKRVCAAIFAVLLLFVIFTACVSNKKAEAEAENGTTAEAASAHASAAQKTAADTAKKSGEREKDSDKKKSETTVGTEKSAAAGEEPAGGEVTSKKGGANEVEEPKDKAEESVPDDLLERETDSQEPIRESEFSDEEDREERKNESAGKEQGVHADEEKPESIHEHIWVEQTKTVLHDETGHYEEVEVGTRTVIDEEAYEEPVYQAKCICSACGCETDSAEEMNDHLDSHYDPDLGYIDAGYSVQQVVIDTVYHPEVSHEEPVYEQQWVVDSEAYEETVVTGYKCSTCGAVR